jgi:hypothetical protein
MEPAMSSLKAMPEDELRKLETERYQRYDDQLNSAGIDVTLFAEYSEVVNEILTRPDRDGWHQLVAHRWRIFYALTNRLSLASTRRGIACSSSSN